MEKQDIERVSSEYHEKKPTYERFCSEVVSQICELIGAASITPALPIQHRVKSWDSILNKIEKKALVVESISDFSDIAGIRIVLLFQRDMVRVAEIIEKTFKVVKKEDTGDRLGENEFGYGSIHYEIEAPDEWLKVPTLKPVEGIHGEIQLRTAAQHIWAAASHILQYKKESDVPLPLRRTISRASALLEIVDLEFERVLTEREKYSADINLEDLSEPLNTDTLRKLLTSSLPKENMSDHETYSELLLDLAHFNIIKIGDLKSLLDETLQDVLKADSYHAVRIRKQFKETKKVSGTSLDRMERGVFFTHVGLVRQALREKFGEEQLDDYWRKTGKFKILVNV